MQKQCCWNVELIDDTKVSWVSYIFCLGPSEVSLSSFSPKGHNHHSRNFLRCPIKLHLFRCWVRLLHLRHILFNTLGSRVWLNRDIEKYQALLLWSYPILYFMRWWWIWFRLQFQRTKCHRVCVYLFCYSFTTKDAKSSVAIIVSDSFVLKL